MDEKKLFIELFGKSDLPIQHKPWIWTISLNGEVWSSAPTSKLTYSFNTKCDFYFRENHNQQGIIKLNGHPNFEFKIEDFPYDILLMGVSTWPVDFFYQPIFLTEVKKISQSIPKHILEFQSTYSEDDLKAELVNGSHQAAILFSPEPIYATQDIENFQFKLIEAENELKSLNMTLKGLTFRDLFEKKISKSTSQIVVELIVNNTRVEEMYNSFQNHFEHFLQLMSLNKISKEKLGVALKFPIENAIELSPNMCLVYISNKEQSKLKDLGKNMIVHWLY